MILTHKHILTIGPIVLVAVCYLLTAPSNDRVTDQVASAAGIEPDDNTVNDAPLGLRCEAIAEELRAKLFSDWRVLVREPFILGGDLSRVELEKCYERSIVPTVRALAASYFHQTPRHPIVIMLCSTEAKFRECHSRLGEPDRSQYSGLYVRRQRRVVVNIASGDGTLAHELTHALAHADFPRMPEWFDEGLAALHEECEPSSDGLRLKGMPNWRDAVALNALNQGELRLLEDVASKRFGSAGRANLDYAQVRALCLFLQEHGWLEPFYRTCRENAVGDPTGLRSLCQVTATADPRALDDAFHAWLLQRDHTGSPSGPAAQ
ncbi:hypothetical protein [Schlesneria paludicola]|uniref:hypothetical protein n=1 Tax=Schlesneria paludicola TaxID=360056 RepID=UPI00029A1343|nr:hypothetical protein [Schlesneria paludicola]